MTKEHLSNTPLCIAVTGPEKRFKFGWWAAKLSLRLCGVKAKYYTASSRLNDLHCHGIVIGGGDDIDPQHYGLTGDAGASYDVARDAFELKMLRSALKKNIPILGICRGAQLINVALGGTLYQDIRPLRKNTPNRNSIFPMKYANLTPDTNFQKVFSQERIHINSLHNQAMQRVANALDVVARDDDNFVQGVTSTEHKIIGVQWHPEYLPYLKHQRALFRNFTAMAHEACAQGLHLTSQDCD